MEKNRKQLLFGAAYYDEYMPYERLDKDVEMMKKAGINTVRIAESTWSTCEPQEGVFDFSHVERVMNAMEHAYLCSSDVDGEVASRYISGNSEGKGDLRPAPDYGYYASGLPVLCGEGDSQADGMHGAQNMRDWISTGQ